MKKVKVKGEGEEKDVDEILKGAKRIAANVPTVGDEILKGGTRSVASAKPDRSFEAFNKWTESKGYTSLRNLFNAYASVIQTMRAMNALNGNVEYPQSIMMAAKDEFIEEAYRLMLEFFEEEGGAK